MAGVWSGALLLGLISMESLRSGIEALTHVVPFGAATVIVGLVAFVLFAAVAVTVLQSHRSPARAAKVNRVANGAMAALLAVVLGSGAVTAGSAALRNGGTSLTPVACAQTEDESKLPDIYHILLDGYPREAVLNERFGYGNEPFLSGLADRGFDVAPVSHSNYTFADLTLASMFRMRYLEQVGAVTDPDSHRAPRSDVVQAY